MSKNIRAHMKLNSIRKILNWAAQESKQTKAVWKTFKLC